MSTRRTKESVKTGSRTFLVRMKEYARNTEFNRNKIFCILYPLRDLPGKKGKYN